MRYALGILTCWTALASANSQPAIAAAPRTPARPPNVVLILADDMGYGDVSVLNSSGRIRTPHLDRLAGDGIIFTDAHSAGSYCVPSRYGLLTGRYMWRTRLGSGGNLANFAGTLIEPERMTLADLLRNQGYFTGLVGKWHQGIDWALHDESDRATIRQSTNYQEFQNLNFHLPVLKGPRDFGFDHSFATAGSAEMNPCSFIENNRVTVIPTLSSQQAREMYGEWYGRDDNIIAPGYTMDRLAPTLSGKACEFIDRAARRPDQPFFLYYAMTSPHNPIVANREFVGTSQAGAYGDFVMEVDHHVGRLLDKISDLGLDENTLVIFTSDNGPVDRTNGYRARWVRGDTSVHGHDSTGPFQGWKGGLREGGHRVPFFVRWPERIRRGRICRTTIVFTDVIPTLAELLDVTLEEGVAEDGRSFFRALTGEETPESFHDAIVHNHSNGTFAIRQGSFKLTLQGPKSVEQVVNGSGPVSFLLHDLSENVDETSDVSKAHPQKVTEMHELLKNYVMGPASNNIRENR